MRTESKLQAVGLTIYPNYYGKPVRNVKEVVMFLRRVGVADYWLEEYHPTFRTTKIRVARNTRKDSDHEIICTSTHRLELPIDDGWRGVLT
jgi:hypothetical protein